jgi:cell division control protein 42
MYTLGLFDTVGIEDYDRIRHLTYQQTEVFLVFAMIGSEAQFFNVENKWVPEITLYCPGVPFIIVGIKDTTENSPWHASVNLGDREAFGNRLAKKLGAVKYMECDICSTQGVDNVFGEVISS